MLDLTLLQCPDCGAALAAPDACGECGRAFPATGGRPAFFPARPRRAAFSYPADAADPRSVPAQALRFPPRSGQPAGGTYHLDLGHEDVLKALPDGAMMLDIGCGGAQMRGWAEARGLRYLGVDMADDRVHGWLQAHGGPDLFCDAHALPLREAVADAVYAAAVWEHLAFPQVAAAEAARVLKPGGWYLGSMSFLEPWHDSSYYHMTPYGVWMTLRLAGLEPQFIWPEVKWSGFRAIMEMGNKATRPLRGLGRLMNAWYLAPKRVQFLARNRRRAEPDDLYRPIAQVAGAVAWIARKPAQPQEAVWQAQTSAVD